MVIKLDEYSESYVNDLINNLTNDLIDEAIRLLREISLDYNDDVKQQVIKFKKNKRVKKIALFILEVIDEYNINISDTLIKWIIVSKLITEWILSNEQISKVLQVTTSQVKDIMSHWNEWFEQLKSDFNNTEESKSDRVLIELKIIDLEHYIQKLWENTLKTLVFPSLFNWLEKIANSHKLKLYKTYDRTFSMFWLISDKNERTSLRRKISKYIAEFMQDWPNINIKWVFASWDNFFPDQVHYIIQWWTKHWIETFNSSKFDKIIERQQLRIVKGHNVRSAVNEWNVVAYWQWIFYIWEENSWKETNKFELLWRLRIWEEVESIWLYYKYIDDDINLILEYTKQIIDQVVEIMKSNNNEYSINMWPDLILDKRAKRYLIMKLNQNDIQPSRIIIEVLEDWHWPDMDEKELSKEIWQLKKIWFKIAIDDYWSWKSSPLRVLNSNADFLKIDWDYFISIINKWVEHAEDELKRIVSFANSYWLEVIAEKAKKEDLEILKKAWINYVQWFQFWKPENIN